ncbi:uncharacterized protein LOC123309665 isoform X2 [Coccinella septempunctata]|nr:uncharacterized protein LOC123309665 isoform X2 [Coccinella septempunctata]
MLLDLSPTVQEPRVSSTGPLILINSIWPPVRKANMLLALCLPTDCPMQSIESPVSIRGFSETVKRSLICAGRSEGENGEDAEEYKRRIMEYGIC